MTTISYLAERVGVTNATIQRDVAELTSYHHIETKQGKGGGIYLTKRASYKGLLTSKQKSVLKKFQVMADKCEYDTIQEILDNFG